VSGTNPSQPGQRFEADLERDAGRAFEDRAVAAQPPAGRESHLAGLSGGLQDGGAEYFLAEQKLIVNVCVAGVVVRRGRRIGSPVWAACATSVRSSGSRACRVRTAASTALRC
jgi:hypothetical protein